MLSKLEFSQYSVIYSDDFKASRRTLSVELRLDLDAFEDQLTADPDQFPMDVFRYKTSEDSYTYRHPGAKFEVTYKVDRKENKIFFLLLVLPVFNPKKLIFISYSHEDEVRLTELSKYLDPLKEQNLIDYWDDGEIDPGDNWRNEIMAALHDAKGALLLVSQDFLISKFITTVELPYIFKATKEKKVELFWIKLDAISKHAEINTYQAINNKPLRKLSPYDRNEVYVEVHDALLKFSRTH